MKLLRSIPVFFGMAIVLYGCKPPDDHTSETQAELQPAPPPSPRPLLFAHYYTWYSTGNGPHKNWSNQWGKLNDPSVLFPNGTNPDQFLFAPTIRQISAAAYPLIGPYDSDNEAVIRWQVSFFKGGRLLLRQESRAHAEKSSVITRFSTRMQG